MYQGLSCSMVAELASWGSIFICQFERQTIVMVMSMEYVIQSSEWLTKIKENQHLSQVKVYLEQSIRSSTSHAKRRQTQQFSPCEGCMKTGKPDATSTSNYSYFRTRETHHVRSTAGCWGPKRLYICRLYFLLTSSVSAPVWHVSVENEVLRCGQCDMIMRLSWVDGLVLEMVC